LLLTSLVVTNTADSGPGSLRQAILDANNTPPPSALTNQIAFDIPRLGQLVIHPASPLPTIVVPTTIDGTTQPGYAGKPIIELDGGRQVFDGLVLGAGSDGSVIKGLDIAAFGYAGIELQSGGNRVVGNYIGTNLSYTGGPGNHFGVLVDNGGSTAGNTIGGTTPGDANVIGFSTRNKGWGCISPAG
jgi:hypothetical protein